MIPADPRERAAFEAGFAEGRRTGNVEMLEVLEVGGVALPSLMPANGRPTLAALAEGLRRYDPAHLAILRPYDPTEALTVKQAARIAGCAPRTIALWADRYRIGRMVVGGMRISHPALLALLDDDALAVAAMLTGQRQHPAVRPYLERAGIRMAA